MPEESKPWWFGRILAIEPRPSWLLVAPGVWVLLVLSVLLALALRYSLLGRYIYAIGSNEATARLCGINVPRVKIAVYTLAGLATGLAGVMQFVYHRRHWRPDHRRRPGAASHRGGRHRRRKSERRRGDRARHPDRLPDHVGAE